jgi:SAM-dependent methyltransferase
MKGFLLMSDFIFSKDNNNKLSYVGDFEGLYLNDPDPWGQSARERTEYVTSRATQVALLQSFSKSGDLLDVGCGLGYTTADLSKFFSVTGLDISLSAIKKARKNFPAISFVQGDIRLPLSSLGLYDVVVLNQILWYILKDFRSVLNVVKSMLNKNGNVVISNFIFDKNEQQWGTEEFHGHAEITSFISRMALETKFSIEAFTCRRLTRKFFDFHIVLTLQD